MIRPVAVGIVPLVDAAPVLVAGALGFDRDEGLALLPREQPSWAALRDRLLHGQLAAAHLLAPLPAALRLGLGGAAAEIEALSVLSLGGQTVGVRAGRAAAMRAAGWPGLGAAPGETLAALLADGPVRLGVPFAVSTHALLLRYLHDAAGLPPPALVAVPPPRMSDALAEGAIDAFCVGEPWGSAAVEAGLAEIAMAGAQIWQAAPEKVLAVPARTDPGLKAALVRCVVRAGEWLADPDNLTLGGEILTAGALALPQEVVDRALTGRIVPARGAAPVEMPGFLRLGGGAATFPWTSQGAWIGRALARAHGLDPAAARAAGAAAFRADLYRAALRGTGLDLPLADAKREGALARPEAVASAAGRLVIGPDRFCDGAIFDMDAA